MLRAAKVQMQVARFFTNATIVGAGGAAVMAAKEVSVADAKRVS